MLELIQITKSYHGKTVIPLVDLEFAAEKTHVLIGPSGCGKSTLLRMIVGLIQPDSGTIRINDQELTAENANAIRRQIGYVIQQGGLFPHLSAAANLELVARYLNWPKEKRTARMEELAKLTSFPLDGLQRFPAQLSGGQQQRVALMRALMLDPDILLFDEPLGALDPMIRSDLQNELREIFRSLNKTVILVTHDLHEAAYFADDLILLRDGQIMQRGSIEEFINSPQDPFVTQFVNAQRIAFEGGVA